MVGRFVQHEQIVGVQHEFYHGEAVPFSAGEHPHRLVDVFASKEKRAEEIAYLCAYRSRGHPVDGIVYREGWVQNGLLILREVAYIHVVADA